MVSMLSAVIGSRTSCRCVAPAAASPRMQGLIQDVVDSPALERAAAHAIESRLIDIVLDGVLAQLTEREELWVLVDEIAGSPAVTVEPGRLS